MRLIVARMVRFDDVLDDRPLVVGHEEAHHRVGAKHRERDKDEGQLRKDQTHATHHVRAQVERADVLDALVAADDPLACRLVLLVEARRAAVEVAKAADVCPLIGLIAAEVTARVRPARDEEKAMRMELGDHEPLLFRAHHHQPLREERL